MSGAGGWLAPAGPVRSPRRTTLTFLVVFVLIGASIGGLVFVHWRRDLHLFYDAGNGIGQDPLPAGISAYFGLQVESRAGAVVVSLDDITPVVTDNSADATVRVLLCRQGDKTERLGADRSLSDYCSTVRQFVPGRYLLDPDHPGAGTTMVVLQVTPRRAGHVHVSGLQVRYHRGLRSGRQVTGAEVETDTR